MPLVWLYDGALVTNSKTLALSSLSPSSPLAGNVKDILTQFEKEQGACQQCLWSGLYRGNNGMRVSGRTLVCVGKDTVSLSFEL